MTTPTTLDDLHEILTTSIDHGLDWMDLPTYGGEEPSDTSGVWSWDETRLLVGTCTSDLRIVYRPFRVWSEGDQPEISTGDASPRDAAAWYAKGQEWSDDDAPSRYTIIVALASDPSRRWTFAAERAPDGRGRLVSA